MITRRTLAAAAMATVAAPTLVKAAARPIVIAHRGASGERPEHTPMAYRLAVDQGADFIEPDLVLTKDGHLVARHENEIGDTTDVASRSEFAGRKTEKVIDGNKINGWFTEDFTLAELKTLRARERLPQLRATSAGFDGREAIPTFQEVIDLAKAESRRVGRTIGLYPEMKHPAFFSGIGLPPEQRVADILKANDLDSLTAPVFVQCFEIEPLKTYRKFGKARRVMLVSWEHESVPATNAAEIKAIAAFAEGIGPEWSMVIPKHDGQLGMPTRFVADAHAVGLAVHPWTVRAENAFLPLMLRDGPDPAKHGDVGEVFKALYAAGVDGVFSDFPGLAVKARG